MEKKIDATYLSIHVRETISKVSGFTPYSKSALLDLMLYACDHGGELPDDTNLWRRVCGLSPAIWKKVLPVIINTMIKIDTVWTFPSVQWSQQKSQRYSEAAFHREAAKSLKNKDRDSTTCSKPDQNKPSNSKLVTVSTEYEDIPSSTINTSLEETVFPAAPKKPPKEYFYEHRMIKLNERDFRRWEKSYPDINLRAELETLAYWDQLDAKNWFHVIPQVLRRRQEERKKSGGRLYVSV